MLIGMLLLGLINLYVFYYRNGTSVPALLKTAALGRQSSLLPGLSGPLGTPPEVRAAKKAGSVKGALPDYARVELIALSEGDSLSEVLRGRGLDASLVSSVLSAVGQIIEVSTKDEEELALYYDPQERLIAIDYERPEGPSLRVERTQAGSTIYWTATRLEQPLVRKAIVVSGTLPQEGGLSQAMKQAGEGRVLAALLTDVFSHKLDLAAQVHPGDSFRLVVEKLYRGERLVRYGDILAVQYQGRRATLQAFRFTAEGSAPGYYTEQGENLAGPLLLSPLRRLSFPAAGLAAPTAHTGRGSLGLDYPAPAGTPIRAMADGEVVSMGQRGPLGHTLTLSHPGGHQHQIEETSYSHLARFASGLAEGQTVRAGQIVGFVGQSGQARQPHLHLTVRGPLGRPVDPRKLRFVPGAPIPQAHRAAFQRLVNELLPQLVAQPSMPRGPRWGS